MPHDDAIIVSAMIAIYDIKRILIDNKSFAVILYCDAFVKMNLSHDRLRRISTSLVGFGGNSIGVEGEIILLVTIS